MDIKRVLPVRLRPVYGIVETTVERWSVHDTPTRAAAMSYYFLVTLAPLALFFLWVLTRVVNGIEPGEIIDRAGALTPSADVGSQIVDVAQRYAEQVGTSGPVIAAVIALIGATVLLAQFTAALDTVWDNKVEAPGWLYFLQTRLAALVALFVILLGVLAAGVLLGLLGLGGQVVTETFNVQVALPGWLDRIANASTWVGLGVGTLLVSIAFTWLPRRRIEWRHTLLGSFITAAGYMIGQATLIWYLASSAIVTAFGAAGSIVALVVWIYYTMQVVLFGAELTRVLVERAEEHSREGTAGQPRAHASESSS